MNRDVCEHFNPVDLPCEKCKEKSKSEALFLADELTIPLGTVIGSEVHRRAAAELRRLHAQRDALLKALKYHQEQTRPIQKSIDAIAKAEENT